MSTLDLLGQYALSITSIPARASPSPAPVWSRHEQWGLRVQLPPATKGLRRSPRHAPAPVEHQRVVIAAALGMLLDKVQIM